MITLYGLNLNKREQWLVVGAALALLILLFYSVLYQPLYRKAQQQRALVAEKQATLAWMARLHPTSTTTHPIKTVSNQQLLSAITVDLKAQSFKKYAYHAQQSSSGDIQLSFEKVPYLPWMQWLWAFQNQYRIEIKQLFIESAPTTGVVKTTLTLNALK